MGDNGGEGGEGGEGGRWGTAQCDPSWSVALACQAVYEKIGWDNERLSIRVLAQDRRTTPLLTLLSHCSISHHSQLCLSLLWEEDSQLAGKIVGRVIQSRRVVC